jgi:hypothetical protein
VWRRGRIQNFKKNDHSCSRSVFPSSLSPFISGVTTAPATTTSVPDHEKRDSGELASDNTPENNAAATEDKEEFREGGYGW